MKTVFDIGNTNVKAYLFDEKNNILQKKTRATCSLFHPTAWETLYKELEDTDKNFNTSTIKISCVSFRCFLALRVFLGYDTMDNFDIDRKYDESLRTGMSKDSPFIFEENIPLDKSNTTGLVGTDRLLASFAFNTIYKRTAIVVGLGTATTIDLITDKKIFYSGIIASGIDSSYSGLIYKASHLPSIDKLKEGSKVIKTNLIEALSSGLFIGHASMIEGMYKRIIDDMNLSTDTYLALTGGRASSVAPHIRVPNLIINEDLVGYGLSII